MTRIVLVNQIATSACQPFTHSSAVLTGVSLDCRQCSEHVTHCPLMPPACNRITSSYIVLCVVCICPLLTDHVPAACRWQPRCVVAARSAGHFAVHRVCGHPLSLLVRQPHTHQRRAAEQVGVSTTPPSLFTPARTPPTARRYAFRATSLALIPTLPAATRASPSRVIISLQALLAALRCGSASAWCCSLQRSSIITRSSTGRCDRWDSQGCRIRRSPSLAVGGCCSPLVRASAVSARCECTCCYSFAPSAADRCGPYEPRI